MNWNDLKRKLSSRKFWVALAGFVTSILYALNWAESDITQMAGIITAAGVLAVYIFGEAAADAAGAGNPQKAADGEADGGSDGVTIGFDIGGEDDE